MKVLVIGASGIIGQHLRLCKPADVEAIYTRTVGDRLHSWLDITDEDSVDDFLKQHQPDAVINLAGENRPDVVEGDPAECEGVNEIAAVLLAEMCQSRNINCVHVSTQAVLDAVNAYGLQKAEAERGVMKYSTSTIVRPTYVLGVRPMPAIGRMNPVEHWLSAKGPLVEVCDRYFSVSFAWDVADQLWKIARDVSHCRMPRDVGRPFQLGIPYRVNRAMLAEYLRPSEVHPVTFETFAGSREGVAPRPIDVSYADSIHSGHGGWEEITAGLDRCRAEYFQRETMSVEQRAAEISIFTGENKKIVWSELYPGFMPLHDKVSRDFKIANPKTDEELLAWYRDTNAYIWELSAYHCDPGFNYSGMIRGVIEGLQSKGCKRVLCLGDGIGDLTIALRKIGFDAIYHDLAGSRTADFADIRQMIYCDDAWPHSHETGQFNPEVLIVPKLYDAVVSLDFLEHVPNVEEWVRSIHAALKPGGWFVAQNAFGIGSGENGAMPMHLAVNDRFEKDWDPLLFSLGFVQEGSNWYQKPLADHSRYEESRAKKLVDAFISDGMKIELTADEIEMIKGWYYVSAGESGNTCDAEMFALLDKLGIEADTMDLQQSNPDHVVENHRPVVIAKNKARQDYCDRHPEMESVKEAQE